MEPTPEQKEEILTLARKLVADSGYVAPELQAKWWESRLLALADRTWRMRDETVAGVKP